MYYQHTCMRTCIVYLFNHTDYMQDVVNIADTAHFTSVHTCTYFMCIICMYVCAYTVYCSCMSAESVSQILTHIHYTVCDNWLFFLPFKSVVWYRKVLLQHAPSDTDAFCVSFDFPDKF